MSWTPNTELELPQQKLWPTECGWLNLVVPDFVLCAWVVRKSEFSHFTVDPFCQQLLRGSESEVECPVCSLVYGNVNCTFIHSCVSCPDMCLWILFSVQLSSNL